MDPRNTTLMIGVGIALVCLALSAFYGLRFYPPGEGYEEERRNNRRSLVLLIVGIAAGVAPFLVR